MLVRFIAHAGIAIEEKGTLCLVAPWFSGSSIKHPLVESVSTKLGPTIDFQIPPTKEKAETYFPDVIMLSHMHAHHAPLRDIISIVENGKQVTILYPREEDSAVRPRFSPYKNVQLQPMSNTDTFVLRGVKITAYAHTVPEHLAWHVEGRRGNVLHIADARINTDIHKRNLDAVWDVYSQLDADLLFMSVGGNRLRVEEENGKKMISDARTMSPGEAANLVARIAPKAMIPIGCYNKSLWSTMREYILPSYLIEDELYWALSWTAPRVKPLFLKPGQTIRLGNSMFGPPTDFSF